MDEVVLVPGLGRTRYAMAPLAWSLRREGFRTRCLGVASLRHRAVGRFLRTGSFRSEVG